METEIAPFRLLEHFDLEELIDKFEVHPRILKAQDCFYEVFIFKDAKQEETVLRYFQKEETGERDYLLPDHIWQRMIFAPPVGMGTQLVNSDKLLLPICVINGENEEDIQEIFNDGIVSFRTDHDREKLNHVINWAKSCSAQDFFVTLGRSVYNGYIAAHSKGGASEYLGARPLKP